ncbi:MAG TPA: nucleotide exchange factor GrpE [Candidatus Binatia bacterium]|nr:nucleotide exchange factor GrpE [Candidatus Binatia bacterium]
MTNERPNERTTPTAAGPETPALETSEVDRLRAEIERLEGELAAARRQADEYLAGLQRERAEFLNFKRRTAEEREAMLGLAAEALLSKVLALADDFDRAIEARPADLADHPWVEGIVAIDRKLRALLESEGVRPIEAGPGTRFDPREHDAIMNVPAPDRAEGEIVEEIRRGYRLRDRILRPALVAVASAPETGTGEATETAPEQARAAPEATGSATQDAGDAAPSSTGSGPTPSDGTTTEPERTETRAPKE